MTKYKCGHKTDGVIILDNNLLSISAYLEWAETVGVFGSKKQCWECWNKELDEQVKLNDKIDTSNIRQITSPLATSKKEGT